MDIIILILLSLFYFIILLLVEYGTKGWSFLSVDSAVKTLNHSFFTLPYVFGPIIFVGVVEYVAILTGVSVQNTWLIVPFIVMLRFLAIILLSRLNRVRIVYIVLLSSLAIILSAVLYPMGVTGIQSSSFSHPATILATVIMALGVYSLFSNARFGDIDIEESYHTAVLDNYRRYTKQYDHIVPRWFQPGTTQRRILFAIMITEDLNRPKLTRFIEKLVFRIFDSMSTGIMQVQSSRYLSDSESIQLACKIIKSSYSHHLKSEDDDYHLVRLVANDYNSSVYAEIVSEVYYIIKKHERDIDDKK